MTYIIMAVREVNKLVRDKIPGLILENGEMPNFRIMEDAEFLDALNIKLQEEVDEYQKSKSLEELADVLQVICSISEIIGGGFKEVEYIMDEKAAERGRFYMQTFLESIDDMK
jgi:predicted house-cleaning noncanonical NTP pyrophosphatase (MazG superfamily)